MKQFRRGEIAYKDGHVLKFQADLEQNIVVGDVKPSMKSDPYKVRILLNDGSISDTHCSCPRGVAICHHIAALALYIHYNLSSTDKACSWSARPVNVSSNVKNINDMYGTYNIQNTSIAEVDFENFKNTINNLSVPVGFTWLLKPEPEIKEAKFVLPTIKSFVQDCKQLVKKNDYEAIKLYLQSKLYIPNNIVEQIAKETIGQSENPLWFEYRKNRITASKFGVVLAACKRGKFSKSLFKSLENNANIKGIHAVQWGITNEIEGIKVLEENKNVKVVSTGLWLSNNGFLGASPDGIVNSDYIVEVKCPWKYRNKNLETEIEKDHNYIVYKENNIILINKNHIYWDQIQGQLYLTKRKCCYLVVWTPGQSIIIDIEKDVEWEVNLDILERFFITKYIPSLIQM
ncbi:unnamed protein product [Macrosiphum euphorbiae]|nr:unnamed protein product [Macrosiphum euphorbiae]